MKVTALVLIWLFLIWFIGQIEAILYYYKFKDVVPEKRDEHPVFTIERVLIWLPFEFALYNGEWLSLLNGLCLALMFTFIHDGAYYIGRNKLDGSYPHGFFSQSTTSVSKADKAGLTTPILRTTCFVVGLLWLIILNLN